MLYRFSRIGRHQSWQGPAPSASKINTFRFSEKDVRETNLGRFIEFLEEHQPMEPQNWGMLNLLFPRYMDYYRRPYLSGAFRDFSLSLIEQFPLLGYSLSLHQPTLWNIGLSLVDQLSAWEKPLLHEFSLWIEPEILASSVDKLLEHSRSVVYGGITSVYADQRESAVRSYFDRLYQLRVTPSLY